MMHDAIINHAMINHAIINHAMMHDAVVVGDGDGAALGACALYTNPAAWLTLPPCLYVCHTTRVAHTYQHATHEVHTRASNRPHTAKRNRYNQVCAHTRPVLHHFFLQHWPCAGDWFTARLRYTRSTALSSMAGYVIGLGDRHCANILLDVCTGDVVHIDLGVAFEQGRFLHTPEVVPFRLTPSVVDGMGAMGVEGAMARCSGAAMRVMREHAPALLTIVEVLLHDPLYHWVLTPLQAGQRQTDQGDDGASSMGVDVVLCQRRQRDGVLDSKFTNGIRTAGGTEVVSTMRTVAGPGGDAPRLINADAERALMRIKQKLAGTEHGLVVFLACNAGVCSR